MDKEFIKEHFDRICGSLFGLIVGVLLLTVGFWSTVLLALCTYAGYYFSGGAENRSKFFGIMKRAYGAIVNFIKGK